MEDKNVVNDPVAFAAYRAIQTGQFDAYLYQLRGAINRRFIERESERRRAEDEQQTG